MSVICALKGTQGDLIKVRSRAFDSGRCPHSKWDDFSAGTKKPGSKQGIRLHVGSLSVSRSTSVYPDSREETSRGFRKGTAWNVVGRFLWSIRGILDKNYSFQGPIGKGRITAPLVVVFAPWKKQNRNVPAIQRLKELCGDEIGPSSGRSNPPFGAFGRG